MMQRVGASPLLVAAFLLAGCTNDEGPLAPDSELEGEGVRAAVSCRVELERGTMVCSPVEPSVPAGLAGAVFGGQNRYVQLESSDVRYVDNIFSADVSVRNLITQPIGTLDSTNLQQNGVRVFFHSDPMVTEGSGAVEVRVRNADGYGSFTATDQPYFRYDQILSPGRRSLPKRWEWTVSGSVQAFTFTVFVQAAVPDEEAIAPGLHLDVRTVAIGEYHACALTITGKAYCWGTNRDGQLGDGSNDDSATPVAVRVPAGERLTAITAGTMHTCAITLDGAAYCWGQNTQYQLGNGTASSANEPTPIDAPAGEEFISISAGPKTSCAVAAGGSAYCWGGNSQGQVGNGESRHLMVVERPTLVEAPQGTEFVAISTGGETSCGVTATGSALCWGWGFNGQLGDGNNYSSVPIPQEVRVPQGQRFTAVSVGNYHVCATSAVGVVYCWGWGNEYQLGRDSQANSNIPVPVIMPAGEKFISITAGADHSCALTATEVAYCWGNNGLGQIGNGETATAKRPTLVQMPISNGFRSLGAGAFGTCAIANRGEAYCWGSNDGYRLGQTSILGSDLPIEVQKPASGRIIDLSAGTYYSCALTEDGTAYCWGDNQFGQLGTGSKMDAMRPERVLAPAGVEFSSISTGRDYSCAIATTGEAYCWGYGHWGGLGAGDGIRDKESVIPRLVRMPPGVSFASISVGNSHTCAVTTTGAAYCWGEGRRGQLGNGASNNEYEPVSVQMPAGKTFKSISASTYISTGHYFTCALTTDHLVYCWGAGKLGQLGTGEEDTESTPKLVNHPGGITFSSISTGAEHSCSLASDGDAYCWGFNWGYKIGYGTSNTVRSSPVRAQMPSGTEFVQVSAGWEHTCAIAAGTGSAYCWGDNADGRLGTGASNFARTPSLVQMPEGVSFERISAGGVHVCALSTANEVYCWGAGMIGNGGTAGSTRPIRVEPQPGLLLFD